MYTPKYHWAVHKSHRLIAWLRQIFPHLSDLICDLVFLSFFFFFSCLLFSRRFFFFVVVEIEQCSFMRMIHGMYARRPTNLIYGHLCYNSFKLLKLSKMCRSFSLMKIEMKMCVTATNYAFYNTNEKKKRKKKNVSKAQKFSSKWVASRWWCVIGWELIDFLEFEFWLWYFNKRWFIWLESFEDRFRLTFKFGKWALIWYFFALKMCDFAFDAPVTSSAVFFLPTSFILYFLLTPFHLQYCTLWLQISFAAVRLRLDFFVFTLSEAH